MRLINKLCIGMTPTDKNIEDHLAIICEDVHSTCTDECPVFQLNGAVPDHKHTRYGCDCFKDGAKMRAIIKEHYENLLNK